MFNRIKDKLKNNKALMISLVAVLIILIGGVSYAAYDYSFTGKDSSISTGTVSIKFLESNTNVIDLKNALPISDSEGKKGDSFDFVVTSEASYDTGMKYTLNLNKLSVDSGYTSLSDNQVKVYLTDNSDSSLLEPTLISSLDSNKIYSKTNKHSSTNTKITDKYKLRVWVDSNGDASSWDQDTKLEYKFKVGLKSEEVEVVAGPNEPVLDSAMIPVYYDKGSSSWKKADSSNKDNNWYNYNEKKWANSVTVESTNRSKYLSASVGTEIPMKDILTMQVWIPRYKYKVWNYNSSGETSSSTQEIEIIWESETEKTGDIACVDNIQGSGGDGTSETCKIDNKVCTDSTCNGKTYTHPAFTFGNEEITGFWVGKFEVSATDSLDKSSILYTEGNGNEDVRVNKIAYYNDDSDIIVKKLVPSQDAFCTTLYDGTQLTSCSDTYFILTKPNMYSWMNGNLKLYADSMTNVNNNYGYNVNVDTHMIKNIEWGAVAYLSHSKYGTCTNGNCMEVGINNNYNGSIIMPSIITGCGSSVGSSASETCNAYNTVAGMLASTTQNIYGVYDMSGGAWEYTMANVANADVITMIPSLSGYTTTEYPNNKYYDKYSYGTSSEELTRSKLGDGIKEVYNNKYSWYSDYSSLADSDSSWFVRGGNFNDDLNAGFFGSKGVRGSAGSGASSRLIIIP